jgi:hypothetical protein
LVKNEGGDRLHLQEYNKGKGVKSLAQVYFDWENPSISGLHMAADTGNGWVYTIDHKGGLTKYVIPLNKWITSLRRALKPYKGVLMNPKIDELGVSTLKSVQLHLILEGTCTLSRESSIDENGKEYIWDIFQFPPSAIISMKVVGEKDPEYILPVTSSSNSISIEAKYSMEYIIDGGGKNRRKKQRLEKRVQKLSEALGSVEELSTEVKKSSVENLQEKISNLEMELVSKVEELENLAK